MKPTPPTSSTKTPKKGLRCFPPIPCHQRIPPSPKVHGTAQGWITSPYCYLFNNRFGSRTIATCARYKCPPVCLSASSAQGPWSSAFCIGIIPHFCIPLPLVSRVSLSFLLRDVRAATWQVSLARPTQGNPGPCPSEPLSPPPLSSRGENQKKKSQQCRPSPIPLPNQQKTTPQFACPLT